MFFRKKKTVRKTWDSENCRPAMRISICTGEKTAGFRNIHDGHFQEIQSVPFLPLLRPYRSGYPKGTNNKHLADIEAIKHQIQYCRQ